MDTSVQQQNNKMPSYQDVELDESAGSKLIRKAKTSPFLVASLLAFTAIAGVGAYRFKNRGSTPISLYLIQLRVAAQGTAVGCLTLGMMYQMYKQNFGQEKKAD